MAIDTKFLSQLIAEKKICHLYGVGDVMLLTVFPGFAIDLPFKRASLSTIADEHHLTDDASTVPEDEPY